MVKTVFEQNNKNRNGLTSNLHEIIQNVTFWGSGKFRNEELIGATEGPSKIDVKIILKIILIKNFYQKKM